MFVFWMFLIVVGMMLFYLWCFIFMIFFGKLRVFKEVLDKVYEVFMFMMVLLILLVVGVVFVGMIFYGYFYGDSYVVFWGLVVYGVDYSV